MNETILALHMIGPDRFCTYCGRQLLHCNQDGSFNLAQKAGALLRAEMRGPDGIEGVEGLVVDARCMKRRCRLRRWWVERSD